MNFTHPQMHPTWQYVPIIAMYQPLPLMSPFQWQMGALQMQYQYQVLSADPRRWTHQPGWEQQTAAPEQNQYVHASPSAIADNHSTDSHHSWVSNNDTRDGSAGPPSSGISTPAGSRHKRKRICDNLTQYVVAADGARAGRPWKRYRRSEQPTADTPGPVPVPAPAPAPVPVPIPGPSTSSSVALTLPSTLPVADQATESTNTPEEEAGTITGDMEWTRCDDGW